MKTRNIRLAPLFAFVLLLSSAPFGRAQTLDELDHPLLPKGAVSIAVDTKTYGVENTLSILGYEPEIWYRPQVVAFPRVAFGLGRNIQLSVDATRQFGIPCDIFPDGGARDVQTLGVIAGRLTFRPRPSLQLEGALMWGGAERVATYRRASIDARSEITYGTRLVSLNGTWLPGGSDDVSGPLQADLNGLRHPLMKTHRLRIGGEVQWRWYRDTRRSTDPSSAYDATGRIDARDTRLRLSGAYGIARGLQLSADAYWSPSFPVTDKTDVLCKESWCGEGAVRTDDESKRFKQSSARIRGTWRVSRAEVSGTASTERQALQYVGGWSGEERFRIDQFGVAGTWLSRRPLKKLERKNLAVFDHPLLEAGQFAIDGRLEYTAGRTGYWVYDYTHWQWSVGATGGLSSGIQAAGYFGQVIMKRELIDESGPRPSCGAELTFRVTPRAQVVVRGDIRRPESFYSFPLFVYYDMLHHYESFAAADLDGTRSLTVGVRMIW